MVLARSKIQGLGLYAARDLEKGQMIIEYIGQVGYELVFFKGTMTLLIVI